MQLKSEVFPEPLGPITATVSPCAMVSPTPASAVMPPKWSSTSRTSSSPSIPWKWFLEVGREVLDRGDLLHRPVGGLQRPHQPHGVEAVMPVGAEGDGGTEPALVVVLYGLHRLDEALAGQVPAGALEALQHHHDVGRALHREALAPLELGV